SVGSAAEQVAAERARGGCRDLCRQREAEERVARENLVKVQENRAATVKAVELDRKIADAEEDLRRGNTKETAKEADPQSASMAKAIGVDQDLIAALSHAIFAIAIELGSGVGFWLVFGHGRREEQTPSMEVTQMDRADAQELVVIEEKPEDIIERFFLE